MKKINVKTRQFLENVPLPVYTEGNYTVVKHTKAIDIIEACLDQNNLQIVKEQLFTQSNGNVAGGNLVLNYNIDEESEAVITFLNSYNKSLAFRVNAALKMKESGNLFVLGSNVYGSYKRVHKGRANQAINEALCKTIFTIRDDYSLLLEQKEKLKNIVLDQEDIMLLLADMFFNEDLLSSEQVNQVKFELKKPTYTYNCDSCSAFHIYMLCALAFQNRNSLISKFYENHKKLNDYFKTKYIDLNEGKILYSSFVPGTECATSV